MTSIYVTRYDHKQSRTTEWFWHARMFLEAGSVLCKSYASDTERDNLLLAPLVFNVRHGLELMLKFLAFGTGSTAKEIAHHDISNLFSRVCAELSTLDDSTLDFASSGLGIERELLEEGLQIMVNHVETVTHKYWSYGFLATPIEDPKNELFRYPSNSTAGAFSIERGTLYLSAEEVANDIKLLSDFQWFVYLAFAKNEKGLHTFDGVP